MTPSLKLVIHLCISVVVLLGATSESHARSSCFYLPLPKLFRYIGCSIIENGGISFVLWMKLRQNLSSIQSVPHH